MKKRRAMIALSFVRSINGFFGCSVFKTDTTFTSGRGAESNAGRIAGTDHEGVDMSAHTYRITLEYTGGRAEGPQAAAPLSFTASNHDNLFEIIAKVQSSGMFDPDTAASLALGMKLFSEVMLQHRKDPLFEPIAGAYREFIGQFKTRMKELQPKAGDQT
jgi:hypothetical protein